MRVHCRSLRRANFASPAWGCRLAYFAYCREVRPFDVVTTKPPGLHLDSLSRQLPMERRESGCVRFALNGILQARLGQDIASCRMFDLPSKPPSTLELSLSLPPSHPPTLRPPFPPPRYHSPSRFIVASSFLPHLFDFRMPQFLLDVF